MDGRSQSAIGWITCGMLEEGKLSCDEYSDLFDMAIKTNHKKDQDGQPLPRPPKEVLAVPQL
jgi:hypothetical protein